MTGSHTRGIAARNVHQVKTRLGGVDDSVRDRICLMSFLPMFQTYERQSRSQHGPSLFSNLAQISQIVKLSVLPKVLVCRGASSECLRDQVCPPSLLSCASPVPALDTHPARSRVRTCSLAPHAARRVTLLSPTLPTSHHPPLCTLAHSCGQSSLSSCSCASHWCPNGPHSRVALAAGYTYTRPFVDIALLSLRVTATMS